MEILNLQEDIYLKSCYATSSIFWTLVDRNKYPIVPSVPFKTYSCVGSTYLCEVTFFIYSPEAYVNIS